MREMPKTTYKILKTGSLSMNSCRFTPFCFSAFAVSKVPMRWDLFDMRMGTVITPTAIKDNGHTQFSSKNPGGLKAVIRVMIDDYKGFKQS